MDTGMQAVRNSLQQWRLDSRACSAVSHFIVSVLLTVLVLLPAQAEIVADAAAPGNQRPTILTTANGIPQVNIQTPSAAGVSRNTYSTFNVEQQGAILNNARTNTATQIGGMVTANPWLAHGSARIILNEVNSSSPSQLNGYLEVAGQRAQVVVANPAGINCDGCGFINANHATLTTGTAIINAGNLEGYRVQQGNINFNGNGMDASTTDYTDILARSVQVNAGIWANQLNVIAGANEISPNQTSITPIGTTGNAPAYAVDVSQLGGMYAGKIMLISTEHGVGVRNAGDISSTRYGMVVTADGRLENAGFMTSAGSAQLSLQGDVQNSGTVYSQGDTQLTTQANLTNTGTLQSDANMAVNAQGHIDNSAVIYAQTNATLSAVGNISNDDLIAARGNATLNANNYLGSASSVVAAGVNNITGDLAINANQTIVSSGQHQAAHTLNFNAQSIDVSNSLTSASTLQLDATNGYVDTQYAEILATSSAAINASQLLNNDNGLISSAAVTLSAQTLSNVNGEITGNNTTLQIQNNLDNTNGLIDGNTTHIAVGGTLTNAGGARIYGDDLAIAASTLNNIGDAPTINTDGSLSYNGQAPVIAARSALNLGVGVLNNTERASILSSNLFGNGDLAIGGALDSNWQATGSATQINNISASIEAMGNLVMNAGVVNNNNAHLTLQHDVFVSQETFFYYQIAGRARHYTPDEVLRHNWVHEHMAPLDELTLAASQNRSDYYVVQNVCVAMASDQDGNSYCSQYVENHINSFSNWTYNQRGTTNTVQVAEPSQSCDENNYCVITSNFDQAVAWVRDSNGVENIYQYNWIGPGYYQDFYQYNYVTTTTETQIVSSEPAQIMAGGDIHFSVAQLNNRDSQILAGGALSVVDQAANVIDPGVYNISTPGQHTEVDDGTVGHFIYTDRQHTPANLSARLPSAPQISTIYPAQSQGEGGRAPDIISQLDDATVIRTGNGVINLPSSSLYILNSNPDAHYLIETDPRFTNNLQWLSSQYMLNQFNFDEPYKLLGDGFYEQRLIADQIKDLTGMRSLPGFYDDEVAYLALMNNGVAVGRELQLTPGVALTVEQIGSLASDIVWLVERDVTLPNGSSQKVLVPQVYLRVQAGDIDGSGALMSGNSVNLDINGFMQNSGNLSARTAVTIRAQDISNTNRIQGDSLNLGVRNDINNTGGVMLAGSELKLDAGNDLNVTTTTYNAFGDNGRVSSSRQGLDRVAGLYVSNPNGVLLASAGNNINLTAADIRNDGVMTMFDAGNDLNFNTVTESKNLNLDWDARNYHHDASSQELGTRIQTAGDITLNAGNDLNARAAQVRSEQGSLIASAGHDILISSGERSQHLDNAVYYESNGLLSSTATTIRDSYSQTDTVASTFSAASASLRAGNNLNITGSHVVADHDITLAASNDININAAQASQSESHFFDQKKSGLMSSGLTVTLGSQQQTTDADSERTFAVASTVGSTGGNVTINAGNVYNQTGSNVLAMSAASSQVETDNAVAGAASGAQSVNEASTGNISITAQQVNIVEANNTAQYVEDNRFEQSGLSLGINSDIIKAAQTASRMQHAAEQTSDSRLDALAVFSTSVALSMGTDAIASAIVDPSKAVSVSLSLGQSEHQSHVVQTSTQAVGSTVQAAGNLRITATSPSDEASPVGAPSGAQIANDITVSGSTVTGHNITLDAANDIHLLAAQNRADQHSTNSESGSSVGVGFGFGPDGGYLGLTLAANSGRGNADGTDIAWIHTTLTASHNLTLQSGNDTTLQGAVVEGQQITANIGGDLAITSLQDTSIYDSEQRAAGGSVTIGPKPAGSLNASGSDINANYASVTRQSGIQAGDGGFNITVAGHTQLNGSVISSTQAAIDNNQNQLTTATFGYTDIANHAQYDAEAYSVTAGTSGNMIGIGSDSESANSVTHSGISTAQVSLVGAPSGAQDSSAQQLALIDRTVLTGTDNTHALAPIFDAQSVQQEMDASVAITGQAGADMARAIGNYAQDQLDDAQARLLAAREREQQALQSGDDAVAIQAFLDQRAAQNDAALWAEGGEYRVGLHLLAGGLTGNVDGALGAGISAASMPSIAQHIEQLGLNPILTNGLSGLAALGLGTATGGLQGGASAFNVEMNNRQLHPEESIELANIKAGKTPAEQARLDAAACALVQCAQGVPVNDPLYAELNAMQITGAGYTNEINQLLATGLFTNTNFDTVNDSLLRNDRDITRLMGGFSFVAGSAGIAGGTVIMGGGGAACVTTGIGCAFTPATTLLGGAVVTGSYLSAQQGWQDAFGEYQYTEGQRVLASFNPDTYPGEHDRITELGLQGTYAVAEMGVGRILAGMGALDLRVRGWFGNDTGSETAGSIRNVNPGYPTSGRTQNCVNCTIATDATLAGNPATALPSSGPVSIRVLEQQFNGRFGAATTNGGIEEQMLNAGDGARGIVFGSRGANEVGHVFNVVNQNGAVRFLDGQSGQPANFGGYQALYLLRTN